MKPLHRGSVLALCALAAVASSPFSLAQPAPDGPPVVVAPEALFEGLPQQDVDMTPDGRTVVVFWEHRQPRHVLLGRTFDADGRRGEPVTIAAYDNVGFNWGPISPAVAAAADGGFLAGWQNLRRTRVLRIRRFDADGQPLGPSSELTADDPWDFDLCAAGDGFVAAWTAGGDVRVRWLDGAGAPRGEAQTVATAEGRGLNLACNRDGRFALVWNLPYPRDLSRPPPDDLWIRTFDADGRPFGPVARLRTQPRNVDPIEKPVTAMSADGSVAVAWRYGNVVEARFFSPDGRALGPPRELARLGEGSGWPGAGALALADDTFFVYWAGQPDAPFVAFRTWWPVPLYGQSFDTDGRPLDVPRRLTFWWDGWLTEKAATDGRGHLAFVWGESYRHLLVQRLSAPGPGRLTWTTPRLVVAEAIREAVLSVARTGGSTGTVSVDVATVGAGTGFEPVRTTLTFPDQVAGEAIVRIPLRQDRAAEESETFAVALSTPTGGAELGEHPRAVVEIRDDDRQLVTRGEALAVAGSSAYAPVLALDAAGDLCVAWLEGEDLVARCLDEDGGVAGEVVARGDYWTVGPLLAPRPGGAVLVAQRLLSTATGNAKLETILLTYDGRTGWQGPFVLREASTTGILSWLAVAPLTDDGFVLLGRLDGDEGTTTLSRWDALGQPRGDPVSFDRIGQADSRPALATTAHGDVVVAWSHMSEVRAVRLPAAPEGADAAEILTLSAGPPDLDGGPNAVALPGGRFLVAWHRVAVRGSQIVGRILTPGAAAAPAVSPEIVLSTTDVGRGHVDPPSLATAGELLLAAWSVVDTDHRRGLLYVQLFDGNVRPLGGELRIPTLLQGAYQSQATLVANAAGEAAVSWMESGGQPSGIGLQHLILPSGLLMPPPERDRPERPPRQPQ